MTYDLTAHQRSEREHCLRLVVEGGPGWHDYTLAKARQLAKDDPALHGELPREVQRAIKAAAATAPAKG